MELLPYEFQTHCLKIFVEQRWIIIVWKHCRRSKYFCWKVSNGNDIFPIWNLKKGFLKPILTKRLTDPNGTEDLLVYVYDDSMRFLIPKTKKQPPIQDPNDRTGSASAAVTVMLLIIYLPIFIIISKLVWSLKAPE